MNKSYKERLTAFRLSMSIANKMLENGVISKKDYANIDTILAQKYSVNSCSIYR